ncbi:site-specific DNA-methyltransferase [Rhodobacter capsulatus]|uniref:DNA methyltransferase n=1 Tax=Rhodobacter capsulatus TaxID=1061 RepID=UPI0006DCD591|nr:DNA methyltransferase [Rhodobacter capsulatus]KQB15180.1 DNA modification methylase [Rhodobacter capsulatus]KQB16897.1 DNA modification methylase [Rhodobacter capsulatus]PZX23687.1 DNA methylase [Rhodobacter capsulatus]QNR62359.1 site-specific DNA-methyltransferase [Rhodobacter capsulatus]
MNQLSIFDQDQFAATAETFIDDLRAFDEFGQRTVTETVEGIPYLINEFWTAGQRQAHSIHEVSYRACFKAQLPEFFINRLTKPGDVVFDPFMGRGTTPVQAALMGRQAFGNDINPLSVLLTRPRLRPITLQAVAAALQTVDWSRGEIEREDLLAFYHPETLRKLEALRLWLAERAPLGGESVDPVADWIRMVAINRLSGHSPGFFSGRSMPPNQAVSVKAQLKINEKLGVSPPDRDVAAVILKKSKTLLKDGCAPSQVRSGLHTGAAWDLRGIADASVDLTVTSPPFLDIVHYAADNWLRCWFAGIDPETVAIDMHRTEEAWTAMVHRVLAEQARILRPSGYVAFEVGEVRNGKVLLERLVWKAAEGLPFNRLGVMVNDQEFTKTANCWGVDNGAKGTNTNRIVLLQRD